MIFVIIIPVLTLLALCVYVYSCKFNYIGIFVIVGYGFLQMSGIEKAIINYLPQEIIGEFLNCNNFFNNIPLPVFSINLLIKYIVCIIILVTSLLLTYLNIKNRD